MPAGFHRRVFIIVSRREKSNRAGFFISGIYGIIKPPRTGMTGPGAGRGRKE